MPRESWLRAAPAVPGSQPGEGRGGEGTFLPSCLTCGVSGTGMAITHGANLSLQRWPNPTPPPKNKIKRDLSSSCDSPSLSYQQQPASWACGCAPGGDCLVNLGRRPRARVCGLGPPAFPAPSPLGPSLKPSPVPLSPEEHLKQTPFKTSEATPSHSFNKTVLGLCPHLPFVHVCAQQVVRC